MRGGPSPIPDLLDHDLRRPFPLTRFLGLRFGVAARIAASVVSLVSPEIGSTEARSMISSANGPVSELDCMSDCTGTLKAER